MAHPLSKQQPWRARSRSRGGFFHCHSSCRKLPITSCEELAGQPDLYSPSGNTAKPRVDAMRPKMDPFQQMMVVGVLVAVAVIVAGCATSGDRYVTSGPTPDLAGTRWVVTSIDGVAPLHDTVVRADFGVDGRIN